MTSPPLDPQGEGAYAGVHGCAHIYTLKPMCALLRKANGQWKPLRHTWYMRKAAVRQLQIDGRWIRQPLSRSV